jgi:hypothetical protein
MKRSEKQLVEQALQRYLLDLVLVATFQLTLLNSSAYLSLPMMRLFVAKSAVASWCVEFKWLAISY